MCYSAQIEAAYQKLVHMTGASLSLQEFAALYAHDPGKKRPKAPKAMDDAFRAGTSPAERAVWAETQQWNQAEAAILEAGAFRQPEAPGRCGVIAAGQGDEEGQGGRADRRQQDRARHGQADRPQTRRRQGPGQPDLPGVYTPVIVSEGGRLTIKPMRYQCRLAGKPANYDQRFPGPTTPVATA